MTVPIGFDRSKLDVTNAFADDVGVAPTISGITISPPSIFLPLVITALPIDAGSATILGTYTIGGPTVLAAPGTFTNDVIRVGDVVQTTPTGDFAVSTTVVSVDSDEQITLSANPTAANGDTNMTITPPAIDSTVGIMEIQVAQAGQVLQLKPIFHLYDGTQSGDPSGTGYDELTTSEAASQVTYANSTVDLDAYLTNIRVSRTN